MSTIAERRTSLVVGPILADAATMGLHWIYNQNDIKNKFEAGSKSMSGAFFEPPSCPYYSYKSGYLSPYGDELLPLLRSFSASEIFDNESIATVYYNFLKSYEGRLNHVSNSFIDNWDSGKAWSECAVADDQANGMIRVPLTVARYVGKAELLDRVSDVVNMFQVSSLSLEVSYLSAIILERILQSNCTPKEAIASVIEGPSDDRVTEPMKKYVRFSLNDTLVTDLAKLNAKLSEKLEFFPALKLGGKVMEAVLTTMDVTEAIRVVEVSEEDRGLVTSAYDDMRSDDTEISVTLEQCISSIGLSCAMPGSYTCNQILSFFDCCMI